MNTLEFALRFSFEKWKESPHQYSGEPHETIQGLEDANRLFDQIATDYWKEVVKRLYGDLVVDQRGDLQDADSWQRFIQGLSKGIFYKYSLNGREARPFQSNDSDFFMIPSMVPKRGTSSLVINLTFGDLKEMQFFCGEKAREFAAKHAERFLLSNLEEGRFMKLGDDKEWRSKPDSYDIGFKYENELMITYELADSIMFRFKIIPISFW